MFDSRLAVGCPRLSTLDRSNGAECMALRGSEAAAGLLAFPLTFDLPRLDAALLFVALAGEARIVELEAAVAIGTWTMLMRNERDGSPLKDVRSSQVEFFMVSTSNARWSKLRGPSGKYEVKGECPARSLAVMNDKRIVQEGL